MKKGFLTLLVILVLVIAGFSLAYASDLTVRKGGSLWASIEGTTIRINGSIVGEIENDGTVRKSGSIVGEVESNGTIRKNGSLYAEIESSGTLRVNGSIAGEIESGGTIRKNGSIWGSVEPGCSSHDDKRKIAALLIFFSGDF